MLELSVQPVTAAENTLSMLGRKYVATGNLTRPEDLIALSASVGVTKSYYGPGVTEMQVKTTDLPETVKGILADYAS